MKHTRFALSLLLLVCMAVSMVNCGKKEEVEEKEEEQTTGDYSGSATNSANSADTKTMKVTLTSTANPVAGSYTFAGGGINDKGKITGTALGLILTLTLKPDGTGATYTFGASLAGNKTLTGTMSGQESGKAVKYTVDLKK